ncbi:Hypothetical protein, putative, partial [Bodo saltans]
ALLSRPTSLSRLQRRCRFELLSASVRVLSATSTESLSGVTSLPGQLTSLSNSVIIMDDVSIHQQWQRYSSPSFFGGATVVRPLSLLYFYDVVNTSITLRHYRFIVDKSRNPTRHWYRHHRLRCF